MWFIWQDQAFIIYSSAAARKIQHIEKNPHASLHFNGDPAGEDIQVFLGLAEIVRDPPPAKQDKAYMEKYGQGILDIDMNEDSFSDVYNWVLRIVPTRLRGIQDSSA